MFLKKQLGNLRDRQNINSQYAMLAVQLKKSQNYCIQLNKMVSYSNA